MLGHSFGKVPIVCEICLVQYLPYHDLLPSRSKILCQTWSMRITSAFESSRLTDVAAVSRNGRKLFVALHFVYSSARVVPGNLIDTTCVVYPLQCVQTFTHRPLRWDFQMVLAISCQFSYSRWLYCSQQYHCGTNVELHYLLQENPWGSLLLDCWW